MKWVTVKTYIFSHEAELARLILEERGIQTFIKDDLIASTQVYAGAVGGYKLQVPIEDMLQAKMLLGELRYPVKENQQKFLQQLDSLSLKFPVVKRISDFEKRFFVFSLILITFIVIIFSGIFLFFEFR